MWWAVQDENRAALTTQVGRVSNQPSGLLLSPRFPTCRNVYQERCQTIRSGDFLFVVDGTGLEQHGTAAGGATKAPVQRRRPLPAAETGRSCWGSVLIFQSPAKGLRKNQQTQPVAFVSARFPTPRNVYQERCRFVASSTNLRWRRTVQDSNRAALTTQVGRVSNQPSGLLLSPRFPTCRNVYQERCQTIRSGDFLWWTVQDSNSTAPPQAGQSKPRWGFD